jgi:hypothetical protein
MSLSKIGKDQEKHLVHGVEKVIDLVKNAQLDPTKALVKVAQEEGFNPQEMRRIAEAYNVSRSLANQREKQGEARCEPFDLAHADKALQEMYPSSYKTQGQEKAAAVLNARAKLESLNSVNYIAKLASNERVTQDNFKALVKVAGAEDAPERPDQIAYRLEKQAHKNNAILKQAQDSVNRTKFGLLDSLTKAAAAIRSSELPFERLEQALVSKYGDGAVKLADLLYYTAKQASFKAKRASEYKTVVENYNVEPYISIDSFIKASAEFKRASVKCAEVQKTVKELGDWKDHFLDKRGGMFDAAAGALDRFNKGLQPSAEPLYYQELGKALSKINDPKYVNEIRRIRAQHMLTDWLTNDEVIKNFGSTPEGREKVIAAYNDLSSVSPDAAENPVLAKAFVRRMVQVDAVDPYEVGQIANIGTALREADAPDIRPLEVSMAADPKGLAIRANPLMYQMKGTNNAGALKNMLGHKGGTRFIDPDLQIRAESLALSKQEAEHRQKNVATDQALNRENFEYNKNRNQIMDPYIQRLQSTDTGLKMHELNKQLYETQHGPNTFSGSGGPGSAPDPQLIGTPQYLQRNLNSILGGSN